MMLSRLNTAVLRAFLLSGLTILLALLLPVDGSGQPGTGIELFQLEAAPDSTGWMVITKAKNDVDHNGFTLPMHGIQIYSRLDTSFCLDQFYIENDSVCLSFCLTDSVFCLDNVIGSATNGIDTFYHKTDSICIALINGDTLCVRDETSGAASALIDTFFHKPDSICIALLSGDTICVLDSTAGELNIMHSSNTANGAYTQNLAGYGMTFTGLDDGAITMTDGLGTWEEFYLQTSSTTGEAWTLIGDNAGWYAADLPGFQNAWIGYGTPGSLVGTGMFFDYFNLQTHLFNTLGGTMTGITAAQSELQFRSSGTLPSAFSGIYRWMQQPPQEAYTGLLAINSSGYMKQTTISDLVDTLVLNGIGDSVNFDVINGAEGELFDTIVHASDTFLLQEYRWRIDGQDDANPEYSVKDNDKIMFAGVDDIEVYSSTPGGSIDQQINSRIAQQGANQDEVLAWDDVSGHWIPANPDTLGSDTLNGIFDAANIGKTIPDNMLGVLTDEITFDGSLEDLVFDHITGLSITGTGTFQPFDLFHNSSTGYPLIRYRNTAQEWQAGYQHGIGFVIKDITGGTVTPFYIANGAPASSFRVLASGILNGSQYDGTPPTGNPFGVVGHQTDGNLISISYDQLKDSLDIYGMALDSAQVVLPDFAALQAYAGNANRVIVTDSLWGGRFYLDNSIPNAIDSALVVGGASSRKWVREVPDNRFWITWWNPLITPTDSSWSLVMQQAIDTISARYDLRYGLGTLYVPDIDTVYWLDTVAADPYDVTGSGEKWYCVELKSNIKIECDPRATFMLSDSMITETADSVDRVNIFIGDSIQNVKWIGGLLHGNASGQFQQASPGWTGCGYYSQTHGNMFSITQSGATNGTDFWNTRLSFIDITFKDHSGNPIVLTGGDSCLVSNITYTGFGEGVELNYGRRSTFMGIRMNGNVCGDGFEIAHSDSIFITDIEIKGAGQGAGIDLYGVVELTLQDFYIHDWPGSGVDVQTIEAQNYQSNNVIIRDGRISDCDGGGIDIEGDTLGSIWIKDVVIDSCQRGIYIGANQAYPQVADLIRIENVTAHANSLEGFYSEASKRIEIIGGSYSQNVNDGIHLAPQGDSPTGFDANDLVVDGAFCRDNGRYGVYLQTYALSYGPKGYVRVYATGNTSGDIEADWTGFSGFTDTTLFYLKNEKPFMTSGGSSPSVGGERFVYQNGATLNNLRAPSHTQIVTVYCPGGCTIQDAGGNIELGGSDLSVGVDQSVQFLYNAIDEVWYPITGVTGVDGMSSWTISATGTGGTEQIDDGETVTFDGDNTIHAYRSGSGAGPHIITYKVDTTVIATLYDLSLVGGGGLMDSIKLAASGTAGHAQIVDGSTITIAGGGINTATRVGSTVTVTGTEVDGSTTNEAWTIDGDGGDTELISNQTVLFAGSGIASTSYSSGSNTLTITATEVDGSTSNELQTFSNTSDATSHTVTLSSSGGSVQFVEGSGIGLSTSGTASDGILTISATGSADGNGIFTPSNDGSTMSCTDHQFDVDMGGTDDLDFDNGVFYISSINGNVGMGTTSTDATYTAHIRGTTPDLLIESSTDGAGIPTLDFEDQMDATGVIGEIQFKATDTDLGGTANLGLLQMYKGSSSAFQDQELRFLLTRTGATENEVLTLHGTTSASQAYYWTENSYGVQNSGSRAYSEASTQTLTTGDYNFIYTGSTAITVNLPAESSTLQGMEYTITNLGTQSINISPNGGKIDNSSSSVPLGANNSVIVKAVYWDGSDLIWFTYD